MIFGAGLTGTVATAFLTVLLFPGVSISAESLSASRTSFAVPAGLRGRVDFWKDIFVKYGENHRVFHHREHPEIIYSVVDFTEFENTYTGRKLQQLKEQTVEREQARIQGALRHLSRGAAPRNSFERRLQTLFARKFGAGNTRRYREAIDLIRYQRGIKERFYEGLVRSGRYLYAIEAILRQEGLPVEIGRLPLVESSFNYEAYSSVGAAGIWQFMRATAKRYMRVDASIDERRDPIIATRAAAQYLKHAYGKLGKWPLAITSYNHGLTGVMRAVKTVGSSDIERIIERYKGKTFGFASGNFYAEFLAALEVEQNAEQYFPGLKREQPWRFDEVIIGRSLLFRDIVRLTRSGAEDLQRLNLAFKANVVKNGVRIPAGSIVKVPQGKGKLLLASVSGSKVVPLSGAVMIASNKTAPVGKRYIVQRGDTLGRIAQRHGVASADLMYANNIDNPNTLQAGRALIIPTFEPLPTAAKAAPVQPEVKVAKATITEADDEIVGDRAANPEEYKVRSGDSLSAIAERFDVEKAAIAKANDIADPDVIQPGEKLVIPAALVAPAAPPAEEPAQVEPPQRYVVRAGDTLGAIGVKFNVSTRALMEANAISDPRSLRPGAELLVPETISVNGGGDAPAPEPERTRAETTYTVRSGDTLLGIASRLGVSVDEIKSSNGIRNPRRLRPGQELVIPDSIGSKTGSASVSEARSYTVVAGDTLSAIARRFGTTVKSLRANNPELGSTLFPGQTLEVK